MNCCADFPRVTGTRAAVNPALAGVKVRTVVRTVRMYPKEISPEKGMQGYVGNSKAKGREKCKKEPNRPVRLKHAGFGFERFRATVRVKRLGEVVSVLH
jgi:hypothetical protein